MIESKRINGIDLRYALIDPKIDEVEATYKPGATVKELGQGYDVAINFNYADTNSGAPIGRLIVEGKEVVNDIPKTTARDELYMMPDTTLHIGKAPKGAVWSVQGSPPLLRNGKIVVSEGIQRDQLGQDIWTRKAYRTAVGITYDGKLVVVRTKDELFLTELAEIMLKFGCVDALNGDGGGSSYMWPEDNGWGRKLGSAIVANEGVKQVEKTFKRYTLLEYIDQVLRVAFGKVKFSEIHVHGTWEPTIADFRKAKDKESIIRAMWKFHTQTRGWQDIAQHASIDPDGYIWAGRPLTMPPASASGFNDPDDDGIHPFMFEMIGNFDKGKEKLEGAQLATVVGLVRAIMELWKLEEKNVRFHREFTNQKTCPGSGIEKEWFLQQIRKPKPPEKLPDIQKTVNGLVNGEPVPIPSYLIDNQTYVPMRWIAETLGAAVQWDPSKFEYNIVKGDK